MGIASAAPFVFGVAITVGGSAVLLELVCVSKNYPEQVKLINQTALEFSNRLHVEMKKMNMQTIKTVSPLWKNAVYKIENISTDVWDYVNQASKDVEDYILR